MKRVLGLIIVLILMFSALTACKTEVASSPKNTQKYFHNMRFIPLEIKYKNETYKIIPQGIDNVGKKVGITNDNFKFDVFKITNVDIKNAVAILAREKDPTIYFKAIRK